MTLIEYRTDRSLIAAVTAALSPAPGVPPDLIGVTARTDGAVTLSGYVRSHPRKETAARSAMRVRGVTTVADEIVVTSALGTGAAEAGHDRTVLVRSRPVNTTAEVARPVLDVGDLDVLSTTRWETDGGKLDTTAPPALAPP